jgi:NTP pyrophosphatase (non-canonical NTP hydrolase)
MMTNNEYTSSLEYYGEPKVYVLEEENGVSQQLRRLAEVFEEEQYEDEEEMAQWSEFDAYQDFAETTAIYPPEKGIEYTALGLASEAGEYAGKVKKMIRDGSYNTDAMAAELGDVLWYLAMAAAELDLSLSDIAMMNVEKLKSRQERGKLQGAGDER